MVSAEEQRREMERLARERTEQRSGGGDYGKRVLNFDKVGGYKKGAYYVPKEGLNKIDVVPFMVKTDKHPLGLKPGYTDYMLDLHVHRYVGPLKSTYLCLTKYNGSACPICEEWQEIKEKYQNSSDKDKKEMQRKYLPKQRTFYNVLDADLPEAQQTVQIFEEVWYFFERKLREKVAVRMGLNDLGVQTYYDIQNGKTILFNAHRKSSPEGKSWEYSFEDFLDRAPFHPDILKETYSLDEMLVVPTYGEVRNAFYGTGDSGAMVKEEHASEEPVMHESRSPRRVHAEQAPQETSRKPSEPSPRRLRGETPETSRETPEEAPVSRRRDTVKESPAEENKCPYEHRFGYDCEQFSKEGHCTKCPKETWDECATLHDGLVRTGDAK